ncbi:MAG: T9SS type A sorting domain-containing protein [Candidatus Cloacimonetes bacterium]|nr:T9SS type A sorting domain-containing protein [Candidatus Cloacimonadota bacterium]
MRKFRCIEILAILLFIHNLAFATIINVPGDKPTIQAGINIAVDGDTVLVERGTYIENINYNGKNIVVGSLFLTTQDTSYISQTIIDGNQSGSVVTFESGEDSTAVLNGFTLTNGSGTYSDPPGSGLYFYWGGGIYFYYSSPVIKSIVISDNSSDYGGGIFFFNSSPILDNLTISNNFADNGGGGITCGWNSSPSLKNIIVSDNSAGGAGGGIHFAYDVNPSLSNVIVSGNLAGNNGGGIVCFYSSPSLKTVMIFNNSTDFGAGMSISHSNPILENVMISNNSANSFAGGILMADSNPIFSNVTISYNWALHSGRGIHCLDNSNPQLLNSILWNLSSPEIYFYGGYAPNSITITYSDIKGGEDGIVTNNNGIVYWLEGNIDEDPIFLNPINGNFHLQDSSLCIGAGVDSIEINGTWYYAPTTDIEGNPRPNPEGSNPDMGAYENPLGNPIVFIDDNEFILIPKFSLFQNYPNPFNPRLNRGSTTIRYYLTKSSKVEIQIYNVKGQVVKEYEIKNPKCGMNKIKWDGKDEKGNPISSGIYFYQIITNDYKEIRKCILLK